MICPKRTGRSNSYPLVSLSVSLIAPFLVVTPQAVLRNITRIECMNGNDQPRGLRLLGACESLCLASKDDAVFGHSSLRATRRGYQPLLAPGGRYFDNQIFGLATHKYEAFCSKAQFSVRNWNDDIYAPSFPNKNIVDFGMRRESFAATSSGALRGERDPCTASLTINTGRSGLTPSEPYSRRIPSALRMLSISRLVSQRPFREAR